jgi:thiol-disulfide isomerase/thioredoxin
MIALAILLSVATLAAQPLAGARRLIHPAPQPQGIVNEQAPSWGAGTWMNLPDSKTGLDIGDFRGKVVYLFFFQSWCPGCHSYGFPTLLELVRTFQGEPDVAFVAVQTAFEGFAHNTRDQAWNLVRRYDLKIPVGHSTEKGRSALQQRYRAGGTPWSVVIDRDGVVQFNDFRTTPQDAAVLIRTLLARPPRAAPAEALPASRGGQQLLGQLLDVSGLNWVEPNAGIRLEGSAPVTLVRWFTDGCPFCVASIAAVNKLREDYGERGFQTVLVYHPKPPGEVTAEHARQAAARLGYAGPLAFDPQWSVLRRIYLEANPDGATSVSFLLDRAGRVCYVHPGPVFGPSSDPQQAESDQDYRDIRKAIEALLAGQP